MSHKRDKNGRESQNAPALCPASQIAGEYHDYNGARSIDAFEAFVAEKLGVAKTEL
jgi:hypothetical protein